MKYGFLLSIDTRLALDRVGQSCFLTCINTWFKLIFLWIQKNNICSNIITILLSAKDDNYFIVSVPMYKFQVVAHIWKANRFKNKVAPESSHAASKRFLGMIWKEPCPLKFQWLSALTLSWCKLSIQYGSSLGPFKLWRMPIYILLLQLTFFRFQNLDKLGGWWLFCYWDLG